MTPKYAVIDGHGESAEVILYADEDGEHECDWPKDWPERVSVSFLKEQGLEVIRA